MIFYKENPLETSLSYNSYSTNYGAAIMLLNWYKWKHNPNVSILCNRIVIKMVPFTRLRPFITFNSMDIIVKTVCFHSDLFLHIESVCISLVKKEKNIFLEFAELQRGLVLAFLVWCVVVFTEGPTPLYRRPKGFTRHKVGVLLHDTGRRGAGEGMNKTIF